MRSEVGYVQGNEMIRILLFSLVGLIGSGALVSVDAGSLGKSLSRSAMTRIFKQDLQNHARTVAKPLARSRLVHRYTTRPRGKQETAFGLAPNTHMTVRAKPGRPLKPVNAQRRYGLPNKPHVRETILLPKGFPVRHNKVVGGSPGVGELTSPLPVPAKSIQRTINLGKRK